MNTMNDLPPGTEILETGAKARVLVPEPSSDPNQPLNWTPKRKAIHFAILQFYIIFTFATMCCTVPCWTPINLELGISYDELTTGYAIQVAGLSVGCLIFVPLALRFGLRSIYITTSTLTFVTAVWQANMTTLGEWYGVNIVSGLAGCVNEALVPMAISELFFVHQRGSMNGIVVMSQLLGNYLGPVAGGYVAASMGWRWVWWFCAIFQGTTTVVMILFLEETKWIRQPLDGRQPNISLVSHGSDNAEAGLAGSLDGKMTHPEKTDETDPASGSRKLSDAVTDASIPTKSRRERFAFITRGAGNIPKRRLEFPGALVSSFRFMIFPAVAFCALQYSLAILGIATVVTTQGTLYPLPPYNFGSIGVGNMNLPPVIGSVLGALFGGPLSDYLIMKVAHRRNGIYEPETRLWLFWVAGSSLVVCFCMFGLTIAKGQPWMINAVGAGFMGFGTSATLDITITYAQDSYQEIIGEALIPITFFRNALAAAICFGLPPWTEAIGTYYVYTCLACIAAAFTLVNLPMVIWGRRLRVMFAARYKESLARDL